MCKLEVKNIKKTYSKKEVLKGLDLKIYEGERLSILGPSGCGKSTFLKILAGIIEEFEGEIILNKKDITRTPSNKRNIVVVSQDNLLFPHMNVYENIAFGLRVRKYKEEEIKKIVENLLEEVGLSGYGKKKVGKLSGGEQQRVALIRALAVKPEVILLDEAYSSLDANLREKMRELTIYLQKKHNITTILVTHDKDEALVFSDRVAVMLDGGICQVDEPKKVYEEPKSLEVARFLLEDNFIEEEDKVTLIRPEDIRMVEEGEEAIILERNYAKARFIYTIEVGGRRLKLDDFTRTKYEVGSKIHIKVVKKNEYNL